MERIKIQICYLTSKPLSTSQILISKLANINLQTVSCWFSSHTASYVNSVYIT